MSDPDYEFKKSCFESADEVWQEAIDKIKSGDSIRYITDELFERAASSVPDYTYQRYQLAEHLEEFWEEAKDRKTLDEALGVAIEMKAGEYVCERFQELGGEERLEVLESVFSEFQFALKHLNGEEQHKKIVEMLMDNTKEMDELGIDTSMPEGKLKPALKPH